MKLLSNIIKNNRAIGKSKEFIIDSNIKANEFLKESNLNEEVEKFEKPIENPIIKFDNLEERAIETAKKIIEEANEQKKRIFSQAIKEAKLKEKSLREEAIKNGYNEGYERANKEFEDKLIELEEEKNRLQAEYDEKVKNLEPKLASYVIDCVERLTGIVAGEYETVIYNIIVSAINNSDATKTFIIHVAKSQYDYVSSRENYIKEMVGDHINIEILADTLLSVNECKIETDNCVIDASLDTKLSTLVNSIKLLSGASKFI